MPYANCQHLHEWANQLKAHAFPFDAQEIPSNGLYLLFERGEEGHGGNRIVRVGTHTGAGQLPSRLRQHFVVENKDRSIFRKNIGRALLAREGDAYAPLWELDLTSRAARERYETLVDLAKQTQVERRVSEYMQKNFSFVVLPMASTVDRLRFESKIVSTVSLCKECRPSKEWLGQYSPKEKIRESGLWLVNELYKTPLTGEEFVYLQSL
jgi:hypothetical protein